MLYKNHDKNLITTAVIIILITAVSFNNCNKQHCELYGFILFEILFAINALVSSDLVGYEGTLLSYEGNHYTAPQNSFWCFFPVFFPVSLPISAAESFHSKTLGRVMHLPAVLGSARLHSLSV